MTAQKTAPPRPLSQKDRELILAKEAFIKSLYSLTQIVKIHQENNQLVIDVIDDFLRSARRFINEDGYLSVQIIRGRIFIQDEALLYRAETVRLYEQVVKYFTHRHITGLRFEKGAEAASRKQILSFARMLNASEKREDPETWLSEALDRSGYAWIGLITESEGTEDTREDKREKAMKTYSFAVASTREIARRIAGSERAGVRKALRITQNMVDFIMDDESVFRTMSTIRIYDDYTFAHSVNVAILSMCIGKEIGLSRRSLERLGVCGLFHDLGKLKVPRDVLNKPGKLDDDEFEIMRRHPVSSVRFIIRIRTPRDRRTKILLPPFEHHMRYDLSGYPKMNKKTGLSLFSRILTVADFYDAVTSPRIYRKTVLSPDRALGMMIKRAGKDFDPIIVKVFIKTLGVYPVGTLIQLDKGGAALVMDSPRNKDTRRPWVVLLKSDGRGGIKKGEVVNLADRNPETGKYRRDIVRTLQPSAYLIQPLDYLV